MMKKKVVMVALAYNASALKGQANLGLRQQDPVSEKQGWFLLQDNS